MLKLNVLLVACAAASSSADVTVIGSAKDNTMYELALGDASNGAGPAVFAGHTNSGAKRRALMKFDVAGALPPGSTITSVSLTLHMSMTIAFDTPVGLHRMLADWGEGSSFVEGRAGHGTEPAPGDVTWHHQFYPGQMWSQPGGEPGATFVVAESATTLVGIETGFYTWSSTPAMVADVQGWLNVPGDNFGWMIMGAEVGFGTSKRFDSRENADPAFRPALSITYTPPCYANCDGSSGSPQLTSNDFQCFLDKFAAGDPYANCDQSTGTPNLTANDFQCFLNKFAGGC